MGGKDSFAKFAGDGATCYRDRRRNNCSDAKASGGKKFTGAILLVMPIEVELRCLLFLSLLGVVHHG